MPGEGLEESRRNGEREVQESVKGSLPKVRGPELVMATVSRAVGFSPW